MLPSLIAVLALCAGQEVESASAPPRSAEPALVLVHGGRIRLGDEAGTVVEALLAREGKVLAVGRETDLLRLVGERALERIDLAGGIAFPGLEDAHVRLGNSACPPQSVELSDCRSFSEIVRRVAAVAASEPAGSWIEGRGLTRAHFVHEEPVHHRALSEALPAHPVVLLTPERDAALANRAAFSQVELDPPRALRRGSGGRVVLDEAGEPTGLFLGNAVELLLALPPPRPATLAAPCLARAQEELLARGITTVHAMGVDRPTLAGLRALHSAQRLALRVELYLDGSGGIDRALVGELRAELAQSERLRLAGVHIALDGALAFGGGAELSERGGAGRAGSALRTPESRVGEMLFELAELGLQPALEAHGDRAARIALDLVQSVALAVPRLRALRPRIEGAELSSPRDWQRFPESGVVLCVQPLRGESTLGHLIDQIGPERALAARTWWALAPELGRIAFGTGWPAPEADPRLALVAARRAHAQADASVSAPARPGRAPAELALRGFTGGAAFAALREEQRGKLLPGFQADLCVLDTDLLECTAEELADARVLMTVVGARIAWAATRG